MLTVLMPVDVSNLNYDMVRTVWRCPINMGRNALKLISCDLPISFLYIILADLPGAVHTYNKQQSLISLITAEGAFRFPPYTSNDYIVGFG
jgi:hypothetical protein